MPKARKSQISLADTPYYHCVSRCVRRAYLCGQDKVSGQCYEHRRRWVEKRIHFLGRIFAIDVCAYAVMSNHTHLVLHVDQAREKSWSTMDVIHRWHLLHKGTVLSRQYVCPLQRKAMQNYEIEAVEQTARIWRQRLLNISWFMRSLNEYIARMANSEDNCTGRFWEGRFKSQALLDEAALAACMAYVDLNPVRAKIALAPEASHHTSIRARIKAKRNKKQPSALMPLHDAAGVNHSQVLPFELNDYIELVQLSGRTFSANQASLIDSSAIAILRRLNIQPKQWLELTNAFEECFHHAAGNEANLENYTLRHQLLRMKDRRAAQRLFG